MSCFTVPPSGFERYPVLGGFATNSTSTSRTLLNALTDPGPADAATQLFPLHGARGVYMLFGGIGADDTTYDAHVFGVTKTKNAAGAIDGLRRRYIGKAAVVLGAVATPGGVAAASTGTGRMADAITWTPGTTDTTPDGFGTGIETAFGSAAAAAFSPSGDILAELILTHLGWDESLFIEFDMTGATSGFAMIARF